MCRIMSLALCAVLSLEWFCYKHAATGATAEGENEGEKPARKRPCYLASKFFSAREEMQNSHPHILEWFDTSSQQVKSDIINNAFTKNQGRWQMDLEKPFFRESKQRCAKH